MKYKVLQKRKPSAERRRSAATFFSPEKFIVATPAHIHIDEKAARMANAFNAKAFTFNNHIFFNRNEYQPHTYDGKKLLVHELAHVRQNRSVIARKPKPDPAAEARMKAEEKAGLDKVKAELHAQSVLWGDIHNFFPDEGRKLAGTGNNDAVDYLTTSFNEGDEKQGNMMVHHAAPVMYVGKKYVAETDAGKRKAAIEAELKKIDEWRFATYRIDDLDITNTTVADKIKALDIHKKGEYISQLRLKEKIIANKDMQEFIRKQMPSTPIAAHATPANGGFTYQFDNITINILPDVFDDSSVSENGGATRFKAISGIAYPGTPAWKGNKEGKVTEIKNPPQRIAQVWTVQTFYGPKANPAGPSGYGYGTRPEDIGPGGDHSLRFHEGSHGTAFIEYIRNHIGATPYPNYTGAVGDTTEELTKKHKEFITARDAFRAMLDTANEQAETSIDCAGKSIVQYYKEQGKTTEVKCP